MRQWNISITATTQDAELTKKDFADALHRVPLFEVIDVHIEEVNDRQGPPNLVGLDQPNQPRWHDPENA